jgi:drug/metabolite transporter (DMT)-like permease
MISNANFLMVVCTMLYATHTCLIRYFKNICEQPMPSDLIACYQYIISIVLLSPLVINKLVKSGKLISIKSIPNYIIRCVMIFCGALAWQYALAAVIAVNCIAISCLTPIFILLLAKISLNESLPKEIIFISIISFIGAFIVISPAPSEFNFKSLFAVLAAFLWALNSVFTKKYLSPQSNPATIFFMTAIILSLIAIPYVLLKEHSITAMQLGFLCLITIVFDIANILLIWVFSSGKISLIAPFDFLRVVFTTILSSVFLSESVTNNGWIGITIIIISNLLATVYGNKFKRKKVEQINLA